jgi:hypothetical protein
VYDRFTCPTINGSGSCNLRGNTGTPQNCVIWDNIGSSGNTNAVRIDGPGYSLAGFKIQSNSGFGLNCGGVGTVQIWNLEFGQCGQAHMCAIAGGQIALFSANVPGAVIRVSGNAYYHKLAGSGGKFTTASDVSPPIALVITAAVTVNYWSSAGGNSYISDVYSSISGKPNVSGTKFAVAENSVIATQTGDPNYLPGTFPGVSSTGGQYT